jgi:sec-independent protein translocase protein TatA
MGLDNPIHIAFLLILLLLVFGAKRLPEMGKSLGTGMRGFKDALSGDDSQPTLATHQHEVAVAPVVAEAQPVAVPVAVQPAPAPLHVAAQPVGERLPA